MKTVSFFQRLRTFRSIPVIAALLSASLPAALAQSANLAASAPHRTSFILIVADDLGYGDLGCYGQTKIKTPNLDKLASEGIRFTSFYAGAAEGAPSRASLLLGQHTGHLSIRGEVDAPLQPGDVTIAQVLRSAGYSTGLIGEWGLGDNTSSGSPDKKGFDQFAGYLTRSDAEDYFADHLWRYDAETGTNSAFPVTRNAGGQKGQYIPDLLTTAANNFVRINRPDQFNGYRPFFLMVCYPIPHGNGIQVPGDATYADESWPPAEKNKAAIITGLDKCIGQLMDKLKELKMEDNTLVLFTSGNGPQKEGGADPKFFQSAGPLRGLKPDLYEGGLRVPMIVRWPDNISAGAVNDQAWAFWDLLPTLVQIAKTPPPANLDGLSMALALMGGTQTNRHDYFYWESHAQGFHQAVRMGDWKAVRTGVDGPLELYNLKIDVGENQNVAGKNPEVVAKIESYLKSARTNPPRWPAKTLKESAKQ